MPKTTSEQNFENAIVTDLVKLNGFHPAAPEDYDRELCLIPQSLVRFLQVTQPQAWKALRPEGVAVPLRALPRPFRHRYRAGFHDLHA